MLVGKIVVCRLLLGSQFEVVGRWTLGATRIWTSREYADVYVHAIYLAWGYFAFSRLNSESCRALNDMSYAVWVTVGLILGIVFGCWCVTL